MGGNLDWSKAMAVISYLYILGILLEFLPVVRQSGIPWNMLNPMFGFLLTFAVFFDDSRTEAISMWIIETIAIFFDFLVYRLKLQKRVDRLARLDEINDLLSSNMKTKKKGALNSSLHSTRSSVRSNVDFDGLGTIEEAIGGSGDHKEIKLLRERRKIRLWLQTEQLHINYHLTGVVINSILVFITMIFIISMLTTGGLCVLSDDMPNPFSQDPLSRCPDCANVKGQCQICNPSSSMCYYPY
jgi:hypothetical protein